MKKIILCTALIAISLQGKLFAQEKKSPAYSKTENNFNMHPAKINNRHWVSLPKDEKMIIELHSTHDYTIFSSLESILTELMTNIAFYKDSLSTEGNVRIDYSYSTYQDLNKIRFKKHAPDGNIYVSRRHDVVRLKIEQDTIRIVFENSANEASSWDSKRDKTVIHKDIPAQITFCLNNYENLNLLLQNKGMLNHIIDTLTVASRSKKYSSILYRPFDTTVRSDNHRFKKSNILWENESDMYKAHGMLTIDGSLGIGFIRSMFVPMAELGIEVNDRWGIWQSSNSFIRASATPYFFFEKGLGNSIIINDNWFATLELGKQKDDKRSSVGIGYLFAEKGGYFQNTTMKFFFSYSLSKRITLFPEIIFTNNFKQAYPGVTIRF